LCGAVCEEQGEDISHILFDCNKSIVLRKNRIRKLHIAGIECGYQLYTTNIFAILSHLDSRSSSKANLWGHSVEFIET